MSTLITVGATTLTLSADLYWSDEFAWSPTVQRVEQTITGALVIQSALRLAGRPITLQTFDQQSAWVTRAGLAQLKAWAAVADQAMVLTYRDQTYDVVFRHQDGAIEATPIAHYADAQAGDWYMATLRFMEI